MTRSLVILTAALGFVLPRFACAADHFSVHPSTFVGNAGDCGAGYPAGSNIVTAEWVEGAGLPDNGGPNSNPVDSRDNPNKNDPHSGLFLSKNGPTPDCSAAGAKITGVGGIVLTELGFDYRNGTHCGGGAPRFNVVASDGFHFVGNCAVGTSTPAPQDPAAWTRVRFTPAQAFPPIAAGATVMSIEIVFDEGTDEAPGAGLTVIDNIDINGQLVTDKS